MLEPLFDVSKIEKLQLLRRAIPEAGTELQEGRLRDDDRVRPTLTEHSLRGSDFRDRHHCRGRPSLGDT